MTEKLKVSREVADAIEYIKTLNSIEDILANHSIDDDVWVHEAKVVNDLSLTELATALIVGYEVRMTPHEVIANEHRRTVKEAIDGRAGRFELTELGIEKRKSFVEGIEFILDTLNIKIKGVNDK